MDARKMANRAEGEVDKSLLNGSGTGGILSSGYFGDGPLLDRLNSGEQIEFALQNLTKGLIVTTGETEEKFTSDSNLRTAMLVTADRLLYVVGKSAGDETFSIPLEEIIKVNISKGYIKNWISVQAKSKTYEMYVQKGSDIQAIPDYIERTSTADSQSGNLNTGHSESNEASSSNESTPSSDDHPEPYENALNSGLTGLDSVEPEPHTASKKSTESKNEDNAASTHREAEPVSSVSEDSDITIEVLVSNLDDDPIAGATVTLTLSTFEIRGQTSRSGRCEISLPTRPSSVKLTISHSEYDPTEAEVSVMDGAVIDVALDPNTEEAAADSQNEATADREGDSTDTEPGVTREQLSEELRTLDDRTSREVTRGKMRTDGKFEPEDYEDEFGTWTAAVDAITVNGEPEAAEESESDIRHTEYSKEDVINAIVDVIETVDERPNTIQMNKYGTMSPSPAYRYFDTWSDAVDAAEGRLEDNSEPTTEPAFTKDEVLKTIADIAADTDKWPSTTDLHSHTQITTSAAFRYFDTWEDAVSTAMAEYHVEVSKESQAASNSGDDDETASSNSSDSGSIDDTEFDWVSSLDPLAKDIGTVPEGRLSDVCVTIVHERQIDRNRREAVFDVKTASGTNLKLTIWKKHSVESDIAEGDTLRLDEVRLKRWSGTEGDEHQLSSTRDLSVTFVEKDQFRGNEPSSEGGDEEQDESGKDQFISIGGATESEAESLVEAGYSTTEDLKAASLDTLRSIDGLDDGTALRMKAEFG